jgi:hypothetical protein
VPLVKLAESTSTPARPLAAAARPDRPVLIVRATDVDEGLSRFRAQSLRNQIAHATLGREDTKEGKGAGVEYHIAVDEDRELGVVAFDKLDVHLQLTPQVGRHPGGLDTGDSIAAAADGDRHLYPL